MQFFQNPVEAGNELRVKEELLQRHQDILLRGEDPINPEIQVTQRPPSTSVGLGEIARQYNVSRLLSQSPLEQFTRVGLPDEPVQMLVRKAMSDSGIDWHSQKYMDQPAVTVVNVDIVPIRGPYDSEQSFHELRELTRDVMPQVPVGCRVSNRKVRKRRSGESRRDSKRPKMEEPGRS